MDRLLLATRNPGKVAEFRELLGAIPFTLVGLRDVGIDFDVEETGTSYEENAALKATSYAKASGLLTLADDSGLEVDALHGEPGYLSARYGGPGLTDPQRVELLLRNLEQAPDQERGARFVCVIAVAMQDETLTLHRGEVSGVITPEIRGTNGFGYDPVFFYPPIHKTFAEISSVEKHQVSHRGAAARSAQSFLQSLSAQPRPSRQAR